MADNKAAKPPKEFVRLLKKAIDDHPDKLSLRELARRADLSAAYLSLLLNGERGVPSNDAIHQLERVLGIPQGELNQAAEKPDNAALEFFRRDKAAPIMRSLAEVPDSKLGDVHKLIERYLSRQRSKSQ
jgi:transcriptional regulator with XRE-family HTH domain